jgi:light-regulated signal transduction histidine kinase (bacteriophytochrome)
MYGILTRELTKSFYLCRQIKKRNDAEEALKATAANLRAKNQQLQDFTHIASHDLQEPLRKIMVFGNRLANAVSEKINDNEKDYLYRMQHAASRMQNLIEGLLAYSRITTKAQPFTNVDLNTIIAEVLTDLEIRINETKGKVEVGQLPVLYADPLQMRQLFQNLIGNGLKYHKKDIPPNLKISYKRKKAIHEISISDNGIGFEQKNSERIFGIFQRLVGKDEYEGTGVGLAICKKIVEQHDGSLSAYGEPGNGAEFVIQLPFQSRSAK